MSSRFLLTSLIATIGLFSPIVLSATYPNGLTSPSVNPNKDSIVIAAMRQKMDSIRLHRPTVALVLAGGGAKGACHLGVMEYLEELHIPVDLIAGTSIGGLIGGLYSIGYNASEIDSIISSLDWGKILSDERNVNTARRPLYTSAQKDGYLVGDNVNGLISSLAVGYEDSTDFKNLPIPFVCVATDLISMKSLNWSDGYLLDALRSTMSLPVIFTPFRKDNMVLLDGGMRDCFPTDLARAMGADIIIGIDVGDQTRHEDMKTIAGIVIEGLSSGGKDALRKNLENADIYIRPDMEPYNFMSWSSDDIDSLIRRGHEAALGKAASFDSIARLTGPQERRLDGPHALDINNGKVEIRSVSIKGLPEHESIALMKKCPLKCGKKYCHDDIQEFISDIYSTGIFKSVRYRLLGRNEPFQLEFLCEKSDNHQIELGLRIDTEEAVALMANFKLWSNTLSGSQLDFNFKASLAPWAEATYRYKLASCGLALGAATKIHYTRIPGSRAWHNDNRIFAQYGNLHTTRKVFGCIGGRFQPAPGTFSAFAEGGYDSRNDRYFPTGGLKAAGRYEYGAQSHFASLNVAGAIPLGSIFTFVPSLSARAVFGGREQLPYYMRNYVGGALEGRYFDQQIGMLSMTRMREASPMTAVASLDVRANVFHNFYIDALAEALCEARSFSLYDGTVWGAVLRVSYSTPAGPISTNIHWNSDTHTIGAYLTLGFDF